MPTRGRISGTPSAAGNYNVVVAASDGFNDGDAVIRLDRHRSGSRCRSSRRASGATRCARRRRRATRPACERQNVQLRWDFDDGTPVTDWSTSPTVTHTFTRPGIYYVTVTATDDRGGRARRRSFRRCTCRSPRIAPTASSNIAFEIARSGNARLWVVNQDNDTVSVFDAVTHAKLAEITVGAAPRTVAVAPNGAIWVIEQAERDDQRDRSQPR